MKILKFGGKSLSNGIEINNAISTIKQSIDNKENLAVVISARGRTTNILEELLEAAKNGADYTPLWEDFKIYQKAPFNNIDYKAEFKLI